MPTVSREELAYFVRWAYKRSVGPTPGRKVEIIVDFVHYPKDCLAKCFDYGQGRFHIVGRSRDYRKNNLSRKKKWNKPLSRNRVLRYLGHEITHVKQYLRGELKENSYFKVMWKKRIIDERDHEYRDWPWEVDARRGERKLLAAYERHLRRSGLTFG